MKTKILASRTYASIAGFVSKVNEIQVHTTATTQTVVIIVAYKHEHHWHRNEPLKSSQIWKIPQSQNNSAIVISELVTVTQFWCLFVFNLLIFVSLFECFWGWDFHLSDFQVTTDLFCCHCPKFVDCSVNDTYINVVTTCRQKHLTTEWESHVYACLNLSFFFFLFFVFQGRNLNWIHKYPTQIFLFTLQNCSSTLAKEESKEEGQQE